MKGSESLKKRDREREIEMKGSESLKKRVREREREGVFICLIFCFIVYSIHYRVFMYM